MLQRPRAMSTRLRELTAAVATVCLARVPSASADVLFNLSTSGSSETWASVVATGGTWNLRFEDGTLPSGTTFTGPSLSGTGGPSAPARLPAQFDSGIGTQRVVAHPGYHLRFETVITPPSPAQPQTLSFQTSVSEINDISSFLLQQSIINPHGYAGLQWLDSGNAWFSGNATEYRVTSQFATDVGWQTGTCPLRLTGDLREPCQPVGSCCRTPAMGGQGYYNVLAGSAADDDFDDDLFSDDDLIPGPSVSFLYSLNLVGSQYECSCGGAARCGPGSPMYTPAQLFANAPFCTDTLSLDFSRNRLTMVPVDGFAGLTNLLMLDLSGNDLQRLPDPPASNTSATLFVDCRSLHEIRLENNNLTAIQATDFAGAIRLEELNLRDNQITLLADGALTNLTMLANLKLGHNRLTSISLGGVPSSLRDLDLNDNLISDVTSTSLRTLVALSKLRLDGNLLTDVPQDAFVGLLNLRQLDLSRNHLTQLYSNTFSTNTDIETLKLDNNRLGYLHGALFRPLTDLEVLQLANNSITLIPDHLFWANTNLETVDLSNNSLRHIHPQTFANNMALHELYLHSNRLQFIAHDVVSYSNTLPNVTLHDNELLGCTVQDTSSTVNCTGCQSSHLLLSESRTYECCMLNGFASCDVAARFGLRVNVSFGFSPALTSVPQVYIGEPYRFQPPLNKTFLFRDFGGTVEDITYSLDYTSTRPPEGDVLIAPASGIILTIPSANATGNYSAVFSATDGAGHVVNLTQWNYTVVARPPLTTKPNVFGLIMEPPLVDRISINRSYTHHPYALLTDNTTSTDSAEIYDNAVGGRVSYRLQVNVTSDDDGDRFSTMYTDFLIDTSTAFMNVRPTGTPYNATVTFIAVDGGGRELEIHDWYVQVLYEDTDLASNGPNGRFCLNGGTAVDPVPYDSNFTCSCTDGYSGDNCESARWLPTLQVVYAGQGQGSSGAGASQLQRELYNYTLWTVNQEYRIAPPIITNASTVSRSGVVTYIPLSSLTFHVDPLPPNFFSNPTTGEIVGVFESPINMTSSVTVHAPDTRPSAPIAVIQFTALESDVSSPTNGPNGRDCFNAYERTDDVPFDGQYTCTCGATSQFWGANCDVPLPDPTLEIEVGGQFHPDGLSSTSTVYSYYNQTKWAIGESHRVAPVSILSANITRTLSSGDVIVSSVNVSELTFAVDPLPRNFFVDIDTAEMIGVPDEEERVNATVTANFAFAEPALVSVIVFEFLHKDTANVSNGPNGRDCQSVEQRVDAVPFDGQYTCNCGATSAGSIFGGANCDERAAQESQGSKSKFWEGVEAWGGGTVLFFLLLVFVVRQQVKLRRERNRPMNLKDIQGDILKELGVGAQLDIREHEVGISLLFESLDNLTVNSDDDEVHLKEQLQDVLQRVKGYVVPSSPDDTRIMIHREHNRILLIMPRPPGPRGNGYEDDLVASVRKSSLRRTLVVGPDLVIKDATVAVPSQMPREIPRSFVLRLGVLGEGNFGEVFKAMLTNTTRSVPSQVVAAKTVKGGSDSTRDDLLREAALMALFNHPNLVALIGVVTIPRTVPALVLLEFCENGTLLQHVSTHDENAHMLLTFCADVAKGLRYLSSRSIVHRDIAARNILLDAAMQCKVADFGMSIALPSNDAASVDETYAANYVRLQGELPVRWSAIETLNEGKFSRATDVWSFGVLAFEVMSHGTVPYVFCPTLIEVSEYIKAGRHLPCPEGCSEDVYHGIMLPCWSPDPHERPGFTDLLGTCIDLGASDDIHRHVPLREESDAIVADAAAAAAAAKPKPSLWRMIGSKKTSLVRSLSLEERKLLGPSLHHIAGDFMTDVLNSVSPSWLVRTLSKSDVTKNCKMLQGRRDGTFALVKDASSTSGYCVAVVTQGQVTVTPIDFQNYDAARPNMSSVKDGSEGIFTFDGQPVSQGAPHLVELVARAMAHRVAPFPCALTPLMEEDDDTSDDGYDGTMPASSRPLIPRNATIRDAVDFVVKPTTRNIVCPRDGEMGSSYVDSLDHVDDVGTAIALLSYTWSYKVVDVVQALSRWSASHGIDARQAYIWICSLCLNQHRIVKALSPEELASEFGPRVVAIGQLLPMLDPWQQPIYMTRAWCLFELYTAIQKQIKITIILTAAQEALFLNAMATEGYSAMDEALAMIRSEEATATREADLIAIRGYVKSVPGGFERLNFKIKHHLQEWCASNGAVRSANRLDHRGLVNATSRLNSIETSVSRLSSSSGSERMPSHTDTTAPFRGLTQSYARPARSPDHNHHTHNTDGFATISNGLDLSSSSSSHFYPRQDSITINRTENGPFVGGDKFYSSVPTSTVTPDVGGRDTTHTHREQQYVQQPDREHDNNHSNDEYLILGRQDSIGSHANGGTGPSPSLTSAGQTLHADKPARVPASDGTGAWEVGDVMDNDEWLDVIRRLSVPAGNEFTLTNMTRL
eukprot:m.161761 g.161761  ORF g.161761 m.161761 type:complete len:2425 (-) comp12114_c0_seq1:110-7384(-)